MSKSNAVGNLSKYIVWETMTKPSIQKIIWNDWPSLFAALSMSIMWIINIVFFYLSKGVRFELGLSIATSILCIFVLVWRIHKIWTLFSRGTETKGTLTYLQIVRDRGRFEYDYQVGNEILSSWCPVHKSKHVMSFSEGNEITVLYKYDQPQKSIIKELFQ